MSKFLEIAVFALGGLCLFAVSFLGFALSAGVPLREVAVVGALFHTEEEDEPEVAPEPDPQPAEMAERSDEQVLRSNVGLLSMWSLEAPFDSAELEALVGRLKAKEDDLDRRLANAADRERDLVDRADSLTGQYEVLEGIRAELEAFEAELRLRETEVKRDENARGEKVQATWAETARLFEDGDVRVSAQRLSQFSAEDAARILTSLDPDRALELLNGLEAGSWKEYADAYTKARSATL